MSLKCHKCQREMQSKDGTAIVGLSLKLWADGEDARRRWEELYPMLDIPLEINLCMICYLATLGIGGGHHAM